MKNVLVVLESRRTETGQLWARISWEALAAGEQLARMIGGEVLTAALGQDLSTLAEEAAGHGGQTLYTLDHASLAHYTSDGFVRALEALIRKIEPAYVVFPHSYQVRDFAPRLAARCAQVLIPDVIALREENGEPNFVRQLMQGRLNADYSKTGEGPGFISVQAGAFRAAETAPAAAARIEPFAVTLDATGIRTQPEQPFRESAQTVDLGSASVIVSVGRGIKEQENIALVEELAQALGAELAASRPICDNGWLPMERQVGSSGQTVAPKLYLAVGISGAIQHLVGMKGSKAIAAINKDENAPIFEVADYGIVGDLFEVVPALTEAVRKAKGA